MSDYFAGWIRIGGKVPANLVEELCAVIVTQGVSLEYDGVDFKPARAADLLAACEPGTKTLYLHDEQAKYGHFEDLEGWFRGHGVAYDRHSDAKYEYDAEDAFFRPGMDGEIVRLSTQDEHTVVDRDAVVAARDALRKAYEGDVDTDDAIESCLSALDDACCPEVEPLASLEIGDRMNKEDVEKIINVRLSLFDDIRFFLFWSCGRCMDCLWRSRPRGGLFCYKCKLTQPSREDFCAARELL